MKIGFIGCGNMSNAIISGLVRSEFIDSKDILVFDIRKETINNLVSSVEVTPCRSNEELTLNCNFIVLAVKPSEIKSVVSSLNLDGKVVISLAGGISIKQIESIANNGKNIPILRVMPNINVSVQAGITAICKNDITQENDFNFVLDMFNSIGETVVLPEESFSTFTAIAGSSPAFTYLYIDSLARAALKSGMSKEIANKIAAQAVLGSAKLILDTNEAPWALIDKVCSPGGTTIAGICELEDNKFISTVIKGVDAVIDADKEMINKA